MTKSIPRQVWHLGNQSPKNVCILHCKPKLEDFFGGSARDFQGRWRASWLTPRFPNCLFNMFSTAPTMASPISCLNRGEWHICLKKIPQCWGCICLSNCEFYHKTGRVWLKPHDWRLVKEKEELKYDSCVLSCCYD